VGRTILLQKKKNHRAAFALAPQKIFSHRTRGHLAEVGGVSVGVEQCEARGRVAPEGGDNACAGPGGERAHLDPGVRREPQHLQQPGDKNKSLYLIFVGVFFSQHLGLLLE
jgi:hypothetical protein